MQNQNSHHQQHKNLGGESISVVPNFQKKIKEPTINKKDL